jgi:molybdopterin converting factor small subunit
MEITVKLFAVLGKYLPPNATHNEAQMDIAEGTSVAQLMQQLHLPLELSHLAMINGLYINPEDREHTTFAPGDEFAVFPPVAGG